MWKGVITGMLLAVFITSTLLTTFSLTGTLQENIITGAVIGTTGLASYAIIISILSLILLFFFYILLKKKHVR